MLLPNDRPHQLKLYGNYAWSAFNLGLGFNAGSGRSLTALASNPIYANAGEIPMTIRGEGMETWTASARGRQWRSSWTCMATTR